MRVGLRGGRGDEGEEEGEEEEMIELDRGNDDAVVLEGSSDDSLGNSKERQEIASDGAHDEGGGGDGEDGCMRDSSEGDEGEGGREESSQWEAGARALATMSGTERIEEVLAPRFECEWDDSEQNPAVRYFLTRCPSGKVDGGKYVGSCRWFLMTIFEESESGELEMQTLFRVLTAIREANLYVEPGFWTLLMASVAARAIKGDGELQHAEFLTTWLYEANATFSARPPHHWGIEQPMRKSGRDAANGVGLRIDKFSEDESLRNSHEWTDTGGNTLRSFLENKLGVVAGCALHNKAGMPEAWEVIREMQGWGIPPDVETYTLLLCVVAAASRHGRASLSDADLIMGRMREEELDPHAMTFGVWIDVVAGCAGRGGATWREGQAIFECQMKLGIRPDFVSFINLMTAVASQAEAGVPSPRGAGQYVYDPIWDAEEVLKMLDQVEPKMHATLPMLAEYLRALAAAAKRGSAGMRDVARVLEVQKAVMDSMLPVGYEEGRYTREEHWARGSITLRGEENFFNQILEVARAAMPWGNATLRDALKVVSDMEASGAHPDLRTRELLLDMANLTEARAKNCETKSCETTFESGDARESCGADESGGPRESGGPLESGPARESHFRESGAGTADLVRYAREKALSMDDISTEHRMLRELRKNKREPHVSGLGIPLKYEETTPAFFGDFWDGLRASS